MKLNCFYYFIKVSKISFCLAIAINTLLNANFSEMAQKDNNVLSIFESVAMADETDPNVNGIKEPVLSALMQRDVRMPHTNQVVNGDIANVVNIKVDKALGSKSILGHEITKISSPHKDLLDLITKLSDSAKIGVIDKENAIEIKEILLGTTSGRIYDGFQLLNFNRWNDPTIPQSAFPDDVVIGEYKTKKIRHSGESELNFKKSGIGVNPNIMDDEEDEVTIWEVDVNMFWYDQQFDSDTFFIYVPIINSQKNVPSLDDTLRINYHIYSLVDEDFAPAQVLFDADPGKEFPGGSSVRLPYKGEDTVWVDIKRNSVTHITVQHSALRFLRGVYTWGWRVHPPRVHFLDFLFELKNAHTEKNELDPRAKSMSIRNRELDIDSIGDAAPEKKIYKVVQSVLDERVTATELFDMLNNPDIAPVGIFTEWIDLMSNQIQLPPEAVSILESEGNGVGDYDYVVAFMNNEMYGVGPYNELIRDWDQGDIIHNRVFNLDNITHYYRNVDFGKALNIDITENALNGIFSFEIFNFKPTYGAPKVAEMQWRTGWGFRPHYSIIQQDGVFSERFDQELLKPFAAPKFSLNQMQNYLGYQYSSENRRGDFIFDPPRYIIQSREDRSFDCFYEYSNRVNDGELDRATDKWNMYKILHPKAVSRGIVIGRKTEGFGVAKMCDRVDNIINYCINDLSPFHPLNIRNVDTDLNGINDKLYFPTFLMNPDRNGGDIIPPTVAWEPFLYLSPENGTIYIDPENPEKGYWADLTYAHGRPVNALDNIEVNIEMPRGSGQLFYQFDELYHDNNIFSPHPISSQR